MTYLLLIYKQSQEYYMPFGLNGTGAPFSSGRL